MKKLLLALVMMLIIACTPKSIFNDGSKLIEGQMVNLWVAYYSQHQLDSMCIADTLPELSNWQYIENKDYETGKKISLYFYLKQDTIINQELLYKAEKNDYEYKVTKRLTKTQ